MIKVSKDGIELSYGRYLSESTTGYVFIIFLLTHPYMNNLLGLSKKGLEYKIEDFVVLFLLFILSTAIGMIISVFAWISLEFIYSSFIERIWFKTSYIRSFVQMENFSEMISKESITYKNWQIKNIEFEEILKHEKIDVSDIQLRRSLRVLLRNLTFILFFFSIAWFFNSDFRLGLILLSFGILLFLASGAVGFYQNLTTLYRYSISRSFSKTNSPNSSES